MTDAARALSFGAIAAEYDRHRPSYPAEAARWLLALAPGRRVVDLGAGTGKLTALLVAEGAQVTAVEPDAAMRERLAVAVSGVMALAGSAEAIPLPDASVDAVLVAQAFHWFDPARALPEISRVLVPGGVLGVLWNLRDEETPWVAALSDLFGADRLDGSRVLTSPQLAGLTALSAYPQLGPLEHATFASTQALTPETLVALVATRSHVALLPADARDALLESVRRLCREHPGLAGRAHFEMPYVTHVFRTRRVA